jgi:hypothetical protein
MTDDMIERLVTRLDAAVQALKVSLELTGGEELEGWGDDALECAVMSHLLVDELGREPTDAEVDEVHEGITKQRAFIRWKLRNGKARPT